MSRQKVKELAPAIRTRILYRVDYFKGVITGTNWIGKELYHAQDMEDAKRLARIRGTRLGYNTYVSIGLL